MYKVKGTPYLLLMSTSPKFHSVLLYKQSPYLGHFETSALNESQMTLNITRSYVPHIYVTSILESQFSRHFALRPAVFELQAILRQDSAQIDPELT